MVRIVHYDFASIFRNLGASSEPSETPCLVLHASLSNIYWIMIFGAVTGLVALPQGLFRLWRETGGSQGGSEVALFGFVAASILTLAVVYCQRKARWLTAGPSGLSITERTTVRTYSWGEVRAILDLGYFGSAPGARRYHVELSSGEYFTFLGDPDAVARLQTLRPAWEEAGKAKRGPASTELVSSSEVR